MENIIQALRSLLQQKLAALADPNRRRSSERGGLSRGQPRGVLGNGLGPLTSMNADRPVDVQEPDTTKRATSGDSQVHGQLQSRNNNTQGRAERQRAAISRYRGWADDYHYSGW